MTSKSIILAALFLFLASTCIASQQEADRFYDEKQEVTPTYVADVPGAFDALKDYQYRQEDYRNWLHAWTPQTFQFTFSSHHIQGVARLPQSNCVVLSGNVSDEARIAMVRFGTLAERSHGILGNNARPPDEEDAAEVITVSSAYDHIGGISTCGNIVAIPIERETGVLQYKESEIRFFFVPPDNCEAAYDLSEDYPDAIIMRPVDLYSGYGSGAVAITRLPVEPFKDHYLVGVTTGGRDGIIWFYLSKTTEIVDGFAEVSSTQSDWFLYGNWALQNISFITQPDGRIYLFGTGNSRDWSSGFDKAFLAALVFPDNDPRNEPTIGSLNYIHFMCHDKYGNFNAAAQAYVGPGGRLALYATPHSTYDEDGSGGGDIIHMHEFPWRPSSPVADAGPDQTVSAGQDCTALVTLDGSASYDPEGTPLTYTWIWDDSTTTGVNPMISLPLGTTTIMLVVNDGAADSDPDYVDVTVIDDTPPELALSVYPESLWPPNHKMVPVTITAITEDNCDLSPVSVITSVSCNEEIDGVGDGNTFPDVVFTGDLTLDLRAERSGVSSNRVYTNEVECTDASGNTTFGTIDVVVPHDRKQRLLR